jgi:hypothetical protein
MFDADDLFAPNGEAASRAFGPALIVSLLSMRTDHDPWSAMPLDDRLGYLRPVIAELLDVGDGIDSTARRARLVEAARRHGAFRRAQACAEVIVSWEFSALREAVREGLRATGFPPETVRQVTRWMLTDWRLARRAARWGFAGR